MFVLSVEDEFSAAHFIKSHHKCKRIHGHNYRVKVWILEHENEFIDFGLIKKTLHDITNELDHRLLVPKEFKSFFEMLKSMFKDERFELQTVYLDDTTAEEIARYIYNEMAKRTQDTTPDAFVDNRIWKVTVWETHKYSASYPAPNPEPKVYPTVTPGTVTWKDNTIQYEFPQTTG